MFSFSPLRFALALSEILGVRHDTMSQLICLRR